MISTLRPGRANEHFAQAGEDYGGAFSSQPTDVDGRTVDVFLGFIYWESAAAREQWYDDYSRMSRKELGWITDGLQKLASLGVQSFCLRPSEDSKEWVEWWEKLGMPYLTGGAKPWQ